MGGLLATTIGFGAGLALVYGMDDLLEACVGEEEPDDDEEKDDFRSRFSRPKGETSPSDSGSVTPEFEEISRSPNDPHELAPSIAMASYRHEARHWHDSAVTESAALIKNMPQHRLHIRGHLEEIAATIRAIRGWSSQLYAPESGTQALGKLSTLPHCSALLTPTPTAL